MSEKRSMKVFKVEVMIVDHDGIGEEGIKGVLENTTYPNRCVSPIVMGMESRGIEWSDDHPLNFASRQERAYRDLFIAIATASGGLSSAGVETAASSDREGGRSMDKRRVHVGIRGTDLEFVFDVDPGFGETSMLNDVIKRAKATLRRSGTKGATRAVSGQKPNVWVDIEEESPEQQIDRLTSFIAATQGKANQGEGVVDTVIRVFNEFTLHKYVVEDEPADDLRRWVKGNLGPTPKTISEENYKKALGALRKEALLYREMQKSMSLGPALVCRMLEDIHAEDEEAGL